MSGQVLLPDANAVRKMLEALTGADVSVEPLAAPEGPDSHAPTAQYILDSGDTVAVAILSLPLAVAVGAALGMVPQPSDEEVKAMDAVPEHLVANVHELANIFAQLLNSDSTPHVRLGALHSVGELEGAPASIAAKPDRRIDLAVALDGHEGTLTFTAKAVA